MSISVRALAGNKWYFEVFNKGTTYKMSAGFRKTNMGYKFPPVRATVGMLLAKGMKRIGSDHQNPRI